MNLREHIATNGLKLSIEGNYGLPVELITPDGILINTNEDGDKLKGQVLYDRDGVDPENGDPIVVNEIRVTLRKSALSRIPQAGEVWKIAFPLDPSDPDTLTTHLINTDEAPIDGGSVGFITLKPKIVEQD